MVTCFLGPLNQLTVALGVSITNSYNREVSYRAQLHMLSAVLHRCCRLTAIRNSHYFIMASEPQSAQKTISTSAFGRIANPGKYRCLTLYSSVYIYIYICMYDCVTEVRSRRDGIHVVSEKNDV